MKEKRKLRQKEKEKEKEKDKAVRGKERLGKRDRGDDPPAKEGLRTHGKIGHLALGNRFLWCTLMVCTISWLKIDLDSRKRLLSSVDAH